MKLISLAKKSAVFALPALVAGTLGLGVANASSYAEVYGGNAQLSRNFCNGLSPNIIDNPYQGGLAVWQYYRMGHGIADISVSAHQSIWGYENIMTVRWTNLTNHRSGVLRATLPVKATTGGTMKTFRNVNTGTGKVRIQLEPTNRGAFLTLPASSCSDVFTIK